MSSTQTRIRQNGPSYFMPVSSLVGVIFAYNPSAGAVQFSTAPWADGGPIGGPARGPARYLSSINAAGAGLLRDIGKQIVSGGRTFRKVELVVRQSGSNSTFGVEGQALGTSPNADYLTGYIEFGFEGTGQPAPVVQYGAL